MTFALAIVVESPSVPGLRPRHVDAPAGAAGGKAALASLDVSWLPGLLERMRPASTRRRRSGAVAADDAAEGAASGGADGARRPADSARRLAAAVKPFSGGFGQLAKSLAFTSNIGWGRT